MSQGVRNYFLIVRNCLEISLVLEKHHSSPAGVNVSRSEECSVSAEQQNFMLLWEGPQFLMWFPAWSQPVHHCPLTSSTSYSNRMESAEAVAAEVSRSRSATIEISNMTDNYCLVNPRYLLALWDGWVKALIVSNMPRCFSGYILKVGKRTTHLSPRFAP